MHEFKEGINDYLRHKVKQNEVWIDGKIKKMWNLNDIIEFNKEFPSPEGYNQDILIQAQATDGLKNNTYIAERAKNKMGAQVYLNYIFQKYALDAIVVPTETNVSSAYPAIAGYPHITVLTKLFKKFEIINFCL